MRQGYIALISSIIISAVLLTTLAAASLFGFFGRFNILYSEFKERSSALAEACVDQAVLKLTENPSYVGGETVQIGPDSCQILPIAAVGPAMRVRTQSIFHDSYTNLEAMVDPLEHKVVSLKELPNF